MNNHKLRLPITALLVMFSLASCEDGKSEASKPTATAAPASRATSGIPANAFPASNPHADLLNQRCSDYKAIYSKLAPGKTVNILEPNGPKLLGIVPAWDGDFTDRQWGCDGNLAGISAQFSVVDLSDAPERCAPSETPFVSEKRCDDEPDPAPEDEIEPPPAWEDASDKGWNWFGTQTCCGSKRWTWVEAKGDLQLQCSVAGLGGMVEGLVKDEGEEFCNAVKQELKFG